jgi:hypothetical protein
LSYHLPSIAPFFAHAQAPRTTDERMVESEDRGLIIATPAGEIEYLSLQASRPMAMAPEVMRLCHDLIRIFVFPGCCMWFSVSNLAICPIPKLL